jgi:dTDP-L-rhamnose 4-epimerase
VRHNDLGTAALLSALYRSGFRGRLVLASSMVVYGEGRYRCEEHGLMRPKARSEEGLSRGLFDPLCAGCRRALKPEPVPEDAPPDPRNVYAATKLHQEHLCAVFGRQAHVPVTALRYHNVYGPRMPRDTPYAGVASLFRSSLEQGSAPLVYEDGKQLRDFVHVRDVAHANVLSLTAREPVPGVFNIASGEPHSVGEMASALAVAFGSSAPSPEITGRFRLGDVRHVFASTDLAAGVLGFTARVGFAEGMQEFASAPLRTGTTREAELRA